MAGGKETPRQKLVGLMYLVLLALLALQVSSDIMFKFIQLDNALGVMVGAAVDKSEKTFKAIEAKANEDKRPDALAALAEAKKLDAAAKEVHQKIESLHEELIVKTGNRDPETGIPVGLKDADMPSTIVLGPDEKGTAVGKDFEGALDKFSKTLFDVETAVNKALNKKDAKVVSVNLTPNWDEDDFTKKDEHQKGKTFLQIGFSHAPMCACLAYLRGIDARVQNEKVRILAEIEKTFGAKDIKFDQIIPMASAESQTVVAGTEYKAQLFITATSSASSFAPKMTANGSVLKVVDAKGEVKIKATFDGAAVPGNESLRKKSWKGVITMADGTGKEQKYEQSFDYFVAKPDIDVQSGAVSALYSQCGNVLVVKCNALGSTYSPSFSASGATVRQNAAKKDEVTIIPSAGVKSVTLTVNQAGVGKLGDKTFKVRNVPIPKLTPYANGRACDLKNGIPAPNNLNIKAEINDEYFKANLPKDSKYNVIEGTVQLVRGRRPIGGTIRITPGGSVNATAIKSQAVSGDRIVIDVRKVERTTFLGGKEDIPVSPQDAIINVPIQ